MSNVIENNPTISIISYTILISTVTWAVFTFVFDENKIQMHKVMAERAKAATQEVEARNSVLISRIDFLTEDSRKLHNWLSVTPKSIPFYEKKIETLQSQLTKSQSTETTASRKDSINNISDKVKPYQDFQVAHSSTSIFYPDTQLGLGISRIDIDGTTDITITFPNGEKTSKKNAVVGDTWDYNFSGKKYRLMLASADWASQKYKTLIYELSNTVKK